MVMLSIATNVPWFDQNSLYLCLFSYVNGRLILISSNFICTCITNESGLGHFVAQYELIYSQYNNSYVGIVMLCFVHSGSVVMLIMSLMAMLFIL